MKKSIAFGFFLCVIGFSNVSAQDTGWETGVNINLGGTHNLITNIKPTGQEFVNIIQKNEFWGWQYSAGFYGRKFFKKNYGIEVGLQYTSFGLQRRIDNVSFGSDIDPINGFTGKPNTLKSSYRHNYFELPIRFVFKKEIKKVELGFFTGLAPAVLTHSYYRTVFIEDKKRTVGKENYTQFSNDFNLIADLGLLLRINITNNLAIDFKPNFRATVLPTYSEDTSPYFQERFLNLGITASGVWKF